ncbi:glycosyltransferase [Desulfosporosinus sp.]|uniref:glycosyltransferase family 2 protein n=1 Tax=Desulfosporosinus sp. TaxID=157907 RepID=UPI0025BC2198|nr:glycosyltransferase [Desulfosporosinus sp.]MBC2726901.1 glycosyltransferase family 2 protein [Desulfosporosinus sp.]
MGSLSLADWLFISTIVAIWLLLLYHVILTYAGYQRFKSSFYDEANLELDNLQVYPIVSVLIPAHNEERVIGRTVEALARLDYPKECIEIIVINDSSTDGTGNVLAEKQKLYPFLKVVTINPPLGAKGKSNALNQGFLASYGEYVVIYDADNTPERRAVRRLVEAIVNDPSIGAVVGKFRTRNRDVNMLTRFINIETLNFQWIVQAGRCSLFGLTTITGTNFLIRRSILEKIGGWNINALTEDTELTVRVYDQGYHITWIPDSVTWEQEPEKWGVWIKQRTRWARGNLWVINYYMRNIFKLSNKRIAGDIIYFFFTYGIFFFAIIISDLIFVLGLLGKSGLTLTGPFTVIWLLAYAMFIFETFISVNFESGEGTVQNLLLICLMYFTYCQLWLFIVLKAAFAALSDRISGSKALWYKTERSGG